MNVIVNNFNIHPTITNFLLCVRYGSMHLGCRDEYDLLFAPYNCTDWQGRQYALNKLNGSRYPVLCELIPRSN